MISKHSASQHEILLLKFVYNSTLCQRDNATLNESYALFLVRSSASTLVLLVVTLIEFYFMQCTLVSIT